MIALRRLAPLALAGLVFWFVAREGAGNSSLAFDPRSLAIVFVLPWFALALSDSIRAAASTASDLLLAQPGLLPRERRAATAARLEELGGLCVAAGVIAGFLALTAGFNRMAEMQGQADPNGWPALAAGLLLGPAYGILLRAFLYEPAAAAFDVASTELGELLGDGAEVD